MFLFVNYFFIGFKVAFSILDNYYLKNYKLQIQTLNLLDNIKTTKMLYEDYFL